MDALIGRVLADPDFEETPPVCVDVGASGALPEDWRALAPRSVCIAFDADARDFSEGGPSDGWRKLYKFNRIVAATSAASVEFHLTRSPHCSSTLRPRNDALTPWAFSPLFEVERSVTLPAISLADALAQLKLNRVDWFKTDSQGTDLRIFRSLPPAIIDRVAVAEFEPGILDAYHGEDKLFAVMAFMAERPFFVSDLDVKGTQRITAKTVASLGSVQQRYLSSFVKTSPGWAEIAYLNDFSAPDRSRRDLLFGWVAATIKRQDGHALALAARGTETFGGDLFAACARASRERIETGGYRALALRALRNVVRRATRT